MSETCPRLIWLAGVALAMLPFAVPDRTAAQTTPSLQLQLTSPFAGTPQSLEGSASGDFLVTTASSRTLTLWSRSAPTEWQRRVIHAPPRDEYAGSYLGAISPDGSTIAFAVPPLSDGAGGYKWGTARIYMIERASQQLVTVFSTGIPTRITRLKFSPDSNHLAAMLGQGCGVRLWTRRQWTNSAPEQKPDFIDDEGYAGTNGASACCPGPDVSPCEALPRGTDVIFTGATDSSRPWMLTLNENGLRTYLRRDERPQRAGADVALGDKLKKPARMALSPDGATLAIGDTFLAQVAILKRDGLRFQWSEPRKIPDEMLTEKGKNEAFLANPVWALSNGRLLLCALGYLPNSGFVGAPEDSNANRIAVFGPEAGNLQFVSLGDDSDSSLYAWKAEQVAAPILFISSRAFSAIDISAPSPPRIISRRIALDLRGNDEAWVLRLNKERKQLYLTSPVGDTSSVAVTFDYAEMRVGDVRAFDGAAGLEADVKSRDEAQGYYDAETEPAWRFTHSISEEPAPAFFGKSVSLEKLYRNELSYSGAKLPGKNMAVWGTSNALRVIDSDGGIACTRPIGSPAFRMNLSPDARMAVVGHGDGTIRWYRLDDPNVACLPLVASVYLTRNDNGSLGFLAWLPNGKFMTGGGAALKNLACYPFDSLDKLGPCIDFQETNPLYSPSEVKRALAEADSTEGNAMALANVVATKLKEKPAVPPIVNLAFKFEARMRDLSIIVTAVGLGDGPRYLTLVAGAGFDLPFIIEGRQYSRTKPFRIDGRQTFTVMAKLPTDVLQKNEKIRICPVVGSAPVVAASATLPLAQEFCREITWLGNSMSRNQRKLWAVLIGFSKSPDDVPQLQYSHEDAINVAHFLQRDIMGKLPGKSSFAEVDIRLVLAAKTPEETTVGGNPRINALRSDLGDSNFHLEAPPNRDNGENYVEAAKSALKKTIGSIKKRSGWEDQILVYYAGHGFSKYIEGPPASMKIGLLTPDSNLAKQQNMLWIEELVPILTDSNLPNMLIIDACSAQIDNDDEIFGQQLQLKLPALVTNTSQMHFFLSNALGRYSYEQNDYTLSDFVAKLNFWPDGMETKGSGVFTLGLMASLLCQEAVYKDQYTFDSSYHFLNDRFFKPTNEKWEKTILPKLSRLMAERFAVPDPVTFGVPIGGSAFSPVVRSAAADAPACSFSAK